MAISANGSKSAGEKPGRRLRIPLSVKFAAAIVALVALLLLLSGAVSLWSAYRETERSALAGEQGKAEALAGRIGGVMTELESQLAWTAQPAWKIAGAEQQRADFTRMLSQFPDVTELFYIDSKGVEQLKVSRLAPDSVASLTNHATEPRFVETVKARTWFGPVYVRNGSELSTTVGMVHTDGGVSVAEIDLAFVADFVNAARQGDGYALVVDRTGRLIAQPDKNPVTGDNNLSGVPQVAAALAAGGTGTTADAVMDDGAPALAAYAEVPQLGWRVVTQASKTAALAPFHALLWQSALLLAMGLLIAAAVGIWLARRVASPIERLQIGAERFGEGDLAQRVAVRSRDEIGALAEKFNTMASRLQQSHKGLEAKIDDRAVGFDIALQQQSLTAEMMKTIARTDYDLERVLDTLIGSTVRLSEANVGAVWLRDGETFRLAGQLGHTSEWIEAARKAPFSEGSHTHAVAAAAAYSGQIINVDDVSRDLRFMGDYGERPANSDERAALAVPLKHGDTVEAVFSLSRADPIPFSDRQVAVTQDFADQALTAIRNVRLLDTIEARDRKLAEAVEQQTAAGNILRVISQSPSNIQSVLDTIVESAARLCNARYCYVDLFDGTLLHFKAHYGLPQEAIDLINRTFPTEPGRGTAAARAVATGQVAEIPDMRTDVEYEMGALSSMLGSVSGVAAPLLKDGAPIGVITLERLEAGALPERQIELLKTFADQAVIAIANFRLFEEVQARTTDLAQLLEQQTTTAEVLKVISRSALDIDTVMATLRQSMARLCGASSVQIFRRDGNIYSIVASEGAGQAGEEIQPGRGSLVGRVALEGRSLQILDAWDDPEYELKDASVRSMLGLPLVGNGEVTGAVTLARNHVQPFSDREIELAAVFADQAAIAIGNLRLFEAVQARNRDVTEALEQQTATAEVLKTISGSVFDLDAVLHTLVKSASDLCHSGMGYIYLRQGDVLQPTVQVGWSQEFQDHMNNLAVTPGRGSVAARVAMSKAVEQIPDVLADPEYTNIEGQRLGGFRTLLGVPLLRDGVVNGVFVLARTVVSPFSAREIELVQTFSDQAVIAIENVRLFDEVQARTADLGESLQQQTATADVLKVISASAFDLQTVLNTLIRSAIPLCEATRGVIWLRRGEQLFLAAHVNYPDEWVEFAQGIAITPAADAETTSGLAAFTGEVVNVEDVPNDPRFRSLAGHKLGDYRGGMAVPLKRDGRVEGVISLSRPEARLFTDRQIELVQTFADQAVIAIENVRLFDEVQTRTAELGEALQQQTATADVLKVISASAFDLQTVLDTLTQSAATLCEADMSGICRSEDQGFYYASQYGFPDDWLDYSKGRRLDTGRGSVVGRVLLDGTVVQVPDVLADPDYTFIEPQKKAGYRTILGVPLLREEKPIGVLVLGRTTVKPFTDKQIELVETFADQAVIAIENVRLFDEVQARTAEVSEALQQQTATGEVLRVIASSPDDIQPVLKAVVESAARLCDAYDAVIMFRQNGSLVAGAHHGPIPLDFTSWPIGRDWVSGRALLDRTAVHVHDLSEESEEYPAGQQMAQRLGHRTILATPLVREDEAIGVLMIRRTEVRPFGEKQIHLLKTFADQAVIAIENARLFDEVQARTADVSEALRQQTATADVLKVISASAFDLDSVLAALTTSAAGLCNAGASAIYMLKDGAYHISAAIGISPEHLAREKANPHLPGRGSWVGRTALEKAVVHVPDIAEDAEHEYPEIGGIGGFQSILCVPLMREGAVIGVFGLTRPEPGPFSERQIELVNTFADQAVIAIENVRLFDEVQARTAEVSEALQQQTATADVLKVISRSAFDLQSVLQTLIDSAARLCGAKMSGIFMRDGDVFRLAAGYDQTPEYRAYEEANPSPISRQSWVGRTALDKAIIHIPDVTKDYEHGLPEAPRLGGYSAVLCVPLMREESVIGVFAMTRPEPGPFTDSQIELVQTLADQAVIAIENVRLFDEVQARTADVSEALRQQTATADVLKVISRAAFDLPTVLDALVESAARLCGASYGGIFLRYGDELRGRATISERLTDWAMDHPIAIDRRWISGRVVLSGHIEHIADVEEDREFNLREFRAITDTRALMGVPLLRDGKVEGVFFLGKPEPGSFTARQSELVQTFADQAVIAIENVRLFDQVQARTQELAASLQDLQAAQGRLLQTEKLASLGQLTAGIAHEIKNPLNFVSNFSLLSSELVDEIRMVLEGAVIDGGTRAEVEELGDTLKDNLNKVVQHARRADSIVRNMLMHSREGSGEHRVVDINSVVDESLGLAYHGARAEKKDFNVTLEKNYDPRAGSVDLYPQEITRVLLNLIANGFYATEKRSAEGNGSAYEPMLSASTRNLGDAVEIRIRDNGTGIPAEVKAKMFNPFFTTKPAGEGTGLGLSLSHDIIVKQHSGTIDVETVPGSFTEFRIVLPRSGVATAKTEVEAEEQA